MKNERSAVRQHTVARWKEHTEGDERRREDANAKGQAEGRQWNESRGTRDEGRGSARGTTAGGGREEGLGRNDR